MEFNITRFGNLIKRDLIIYRKQVLIIMLGLVGLLLLIYGFARITEDANGINGEFWKSIGLAFVFIVGLTFTSIVFRDFRSPGGRLQFLSLPASNFEKLASRWLYSLILFPLFIIIAVWILSTLTIASGPGIRAYFESQELTYITVGFMILHASTFLYAVWFNKLVAVKSIIISILISILWGLLMVGMFWLLFNEYFEGSFRAGPSVHVNIDSTAQEFFQTKVAPVGDFLLKFFVAPFLWVVSYFKMKEKEA